jgi:hypothetical protein
MGRTYARHVKPGDLVFLSDSPDFPYVEVTYRSTPGEGTTLPNWTVGIFLETSKLWGLDFYDIFVPEYGETFEVKFCYVYHYEDVK